MSGSDNSKRVQEEPCQFIQKLARIIEKEPESISFSEDGNEVIIHNEERFTKKLLNRYFRHEQWRSFVRQMNMYGFKKINRGLKTFIFVNPIFRRGNAQNYHLIKRKIKNKEDIFNEEQNIKDQVLEYLRYNSGENSLHSYIYAICELKNKIDGSLLGVKKDIEEISRKRKTTLDIKPIINGIKETIQIVEESDRKLMGSMERYKEYQQNFEKSAKNINFSSFSSSGADGPRLKNSNLVIPQPIPASGQNIQQPIPSRDRMTTLAPTSGINVTSYSSFSFLMNLDQ